VALGADDDGNQEIGDLYRFMKNDYRVFIGDNLAQFTKKSGLSFIAC
jgi:hypothetical protein